MRLLCGSAYDAVITRPKSRNRMILKRLSSPYVPPERQVRWTANRFPASYASRSNHCWSLPSMEPDTIIGIASATIAVVSAVVSGLFSRQSIRTAERSRRQQYFSELRCWGEEASDVLSKAVHLCGSDPTVIKIINISEQRHEISVRLSSLIDSGRWFFPNSFPDQLGEEKPGAYKGVRQAILSRLVMAYRDLEGLKIGDHNNASEVRQKLETRRRAFVSDLQRKLDPRRTNQEFEESMR